MHSIRRSVGIPLAILTAFAIGSSAANAQTEVRRGVLPYARLTAWAEQPGVNLSTGFLADLQNDSNFDGDYQLIFNTAANILSGYRVVNRGGYFPENAGIPREQQLSVADAVYYMFELANGDTLMLYRSPRENTSRYIIRRDGTGFLLPQ